MTLDKPQKNLFYVLLCITATAAVLFFSIERQNKLTKLQLAIPILEKKLHQVQEENIRLKYEINQFESPIHLMELIRKPEFSHLKFPHTNEIVIIDSFTTKTSEDKERN